MSGSLDQKLCEQSASLAAIGGKGGGSGACAPAPATPLSPAAVGFAEDGQTGAGASGGERLLDLGLAFAQAGGLTVYAGLREASDLVNPLSAGFVGNRINGAGLGLVNLALNPEEQLAREQASLDRMWSGLESLASYARETVAGGSGLARAELAGLLAGALITPLPQGKLAAPLAAGSALSRTGRLNGGSLSVDLKPGGHTVGLPGATARVDVEPGTKATVDIQASASGAQIDSLSLRFSREVRVDNPAALASKLLERGTNGSASPVGRLAAEALGGSARVRGVALQRQTSPDGTSTLRPQIDGTVQKLGFSVPIDGLLKIGELLPSSPLRGAGPMRAAQGGLRLPPDDALWLLGSLARMSRPGARLDATVDPALLGLPARGPVQLSGTFSARGSARGPEIHDSELEIRGGGVKGKFNFSGTLERE